MFFLVDWVGQRSVSIRNWLLRLVCGVSPTAWTSKRTEQTSSSSLHRCIRWSPRDTSCIYKDSEGESHIMFFKVYRYKYTQIRRAFSGWCDSSFIQWFSWLEYTLLVWCFRRLRGTRLCCEPVKHEERRACGVKLWKNTVRLFSYPGSKLLTGQ